MLSTIRSETICQMNVLKGLSELSRHLKYQVVEI